MREILKGYELSKEAIDNIMGEIGRRHSELKNKIEELESKNYEYKNQINELETKNSELDNKIKEYGNTQEELENLKKSIAEKDEQDKAKNKEETLTKNINEAIGDKKFVNERTKNSIINELKNALNDDSNVGKSAKDLFEEITKDATDIFKNENQFQDMADIKEIENEPSSQEKTESRINPMFKTYN